MLKYAAYEDVDEDLRNAVQELSNTLNDNGIPHAVVGGIAVSTYVEGRTTEDIDILVDLKNMPRIKKLFPGKPGVTIPEGPGEGEFHMWQSQYLGIAIDFLFAEGLPHDLLSDPTYKDGLPVISPRALTALKIRSGRAKDQEDLVNLLVSQLRSYPSIMQTYLSNMEDRDAALDEVLTRVESLRAIRDYFKLHKLSQFEDPLRDALEEALVKSMSKPKPSTKKPPKPVVVDPETLDMGIDDVDF